MRKRNALLLAAVSAFALMTTNATNAAYQCVWSNGVKVCGNEFGFAPSVGGVSDRRDQFSGDRDNSDDPGGPEGSESADASEGHDNCGGPGAQ